MSLAQAKRELQSLLMPAVEIVRGVLTNRTACPLCGNINFRDPLALKAAEIVFDRTGLGPTVTHDLHTTLDHNLIVENMTDQELAIVDGVMQQVMARIEAAERPGTLLTQNVHPESEVTRWVSHRLCRLNPKGSAVPA